MRLVDVAVCGFVGMAIGVAAGSVAWVVSGWMLQVLLWVARMGV